MNANTLFNAYKTVTHKIKVLDAMPLYAFESGKIQQRKQKIAERVRLQRKLDYRLSYFLEYGKAPAPIHCVICGWWKSACQCTEFRPPAGYVEYTR